MVRTLRIVVGTATVVASASLAVTGVSATAPAAPRAQHQAFVQELKDPATGITARMSQNRSGEVVTEVADPAVTIQKTIGLGRSVTTMRGGGEEVTVTVEAGSLWVKGSGGTIDLMHADPATIARERAFVANSNVVTRARTLLARLDLHPTAPAGTVLLVTRAFLGALANDAASVQDSRARLQELSRPRVRVVQETKSGPGWCWDQYSQYLLQIENELLACKKGIKWYDVITALECDFQWTLQAELAGTWVIACAGGLPIK
jgi:hypothetical protein